MKNKSVIFSSAFAALLFAGDAWAQNVTGKAATAAPLFREMATDVITPNICFSNTISSLMWLLGVLFLVASLVTAILYRRHKPQTPKLKRRAIVLFVAAALFFALPFILYAMQGSVADGELTRINASQLSLDPVKEFK